MSWSYTCSLQQKLYKKILLTINKMTIDQALSIDDLVTFFQSNDIHVIVSKSNIKTSVTLKQERMKTFAEIATIYYVHGEITPNPLSSGFMDEETSADFHKRILPRITQLLGEVRGDYEFQSFRQLLPEYQPSV